MDVKPVKGNAPTAWQEPRQMVSSRAILYTLYFILVAAIGVAATFLDPVYFIGGVVGLIILALILKYPFFGFVVYMAIYVLRPGERYEFLAPLRLELLAGVLLLVLISAADGIRGKGLRFPKDNITKALLMFIGALVVSFFFSEWKTCAYETVVKFIKVFILYYYIFVFVDTEKRFQWAFWIVTMFTCLVGIEAAEQYFTGNFRVNQGIMRTGGTTSYGEHSNSMAMYMATTIPMLIYLFARYRKPFLKALLVLLMITCLVTLIITGSRSGILCILGVFLTYSWFSKRRALYIVAIIFISVIAWFALPDQYKERYGSIASSEIDGSSQGRIDAWIAGLGIFLEKPLFGVGPGIFSTAYGTRYGIWLSAHSLYIEMLATVGILGSFTWGLFLWRLITMLGEMRHKYEKYTFLAEDIFVFRKSVYAVVAGLLIAGVFGHILLRDTWYIIAGLAISRENGLSEISKGI